MFYLRCDDRLLHGQIFYKWLKYLNLQRIIIIDEMLYHNQVEKQIILMAKPKNCDISFYDISDLSKAKQEKQACLVLFRSIIDSSRLVNEFQVNEINIAFKKGGIGKKKILNNVFLSDKEMEVLQKLISNEIEVYSQILPTAEKYYINLDDVKK